MSKNIGSLISRVFVVLFAAISLVVSIILKIDAFMCAVCLMMFLVVYLKCVYLIMYSATGWKADGLKLVLGMPIRVFIPMLLIAIPLFFLARFVIIADLSVMLSGGNLTSLAISAALAYTASILSWYLSVKKNTEKGSEVEVRSRLRKIGLDDYYVNIKIKDLKAKGLI